MCYIVSPIQSVCVCVQWYTTCTTSIRTVFNLPFPVLLSAPSRVFHSPWSYKRAIKSREHTGADAAASAAAAKQRLNTQCRQGPYIILFFLKEFIFFCLSMPPLLYYIGRRQSSCALFGNLARPNIYKRQIDIIHRGSWIGRERESSVVVVFRWRHYSNHSPFRPHCRIPQTCYIHTDTHADNTARHNTHIHPMELKEIIRNIYTHKEVIKNKDRARPCLAPRRHPKSSSSSVKSVSFFLSLSTFLGRKKKDDVFPIFHTKQTG